MRPLFNVWFQYLLASITDFGIWCTWGVGVVVGWRYAWRLRSHGLFIFRLCMKCECVQFLQCTVGLCFLFCLLSHYFDLTLLWNINFNAICFIHFFVFINVALFCKHRLQWFDLGSHYDMCLVFSRWNSTCVSGAIWLLLSPCSTNRNYFQYGSLSLVRHHRVNWYCGLRVRNILSFKSMVTITAQQTDADIPSVVQLIRYMCTWCLTVS